MDLKISSIRVAYSLHIMFCLLKDRPTPFHEKYNSTPALFPIGHPGYHWPESMVMDERR